MSKPDGRLVRRRFLGQASLSAGAAMVLPRHVLGLGSLPPSEKINMAFVGVGGRGAANRDGLGGENCVALCDVNAKGLEEAARKSPAAKQYRDFRKMLDEVANSIDAVAVSTPDHFHATVIMAALKRGKAVYSEKPLAHSIGEIRTIQETARKLKLPTQLGNQGHSSDSIRSFCEWIWDGAIGKVHTIHAQCRSVYSEIGNHTKVKEQHPVPAHLDWDLWLGPAQLRPYNPMYEPGRWRSWSPFGTGVIGDWTCHVIDPVFWALDLGAPATIQAQVRDYDPRVHFDTFPRGSKVTFKFPARGARGPVTLIWYDGEEKIQPVEGLNDIPHIGAVVLGDRGGIVYGSHGAGGVKLFPDDSDKAYRRPAQKIQRIGGDHHGDFARGIRNRSHIPGSNFDYGGALTELALLGNIAFRYPGLELKWDAAGQKFPNCAEAKLWINPPYRKGWTL
jgi:predicted dehydrogenase